MNGGRPRGRGREGSRGGSRGGNRGRGGGPGNDGRAPTGPSANALDALTGGTISRRGFGRGNASTGSGARGRGGGAHNNQGASGVDSTAEQQSDSEIQYDPNFKSNDPMNSTPFARHQYKERYNYLKLANEYKKQELIRTGLMDNDGRMHASQSVKKYGLCEDLCAEFERVRRIFQADLKPPEYTKETARGPRKGRVPDESRMVAAYVRPAAGIEPSLVTDLRTPATLLRAMNYMVGRLKEDDFEFLDGWIWDRSRAVRQEIRRNHRRPQDIVPKATCYEICIRFHLLSMHQMAKSKSRDYDRQNHWEQLSAACADLMELWDDEKVYNKSSQQESPLDASRVAEMYAYHIILGAAQKGMHRATVTRDHRIRVAQALVRASEDTKNSASFWRQVGSSQVSFLMACAAATRFNSVRIRTLEALVRGHNVDKIQIEDFTSNKLIEILGFDDEEQLRIFCSAYGGQFQTNADGLTYLRPDTLHVRNGNLVQKSDAFLPDQFFSQKYVESKRGGRSHAAILWGMSCREARIQGLVEDVATRESDSLFVPDGSAKPNPFAAAAAQSSGSPSGLIPPNVQPGLFDASKDSIKFAAPTNGPTPTGSTPSNPFASAAAKLNTNGQSATSGGLSTSATTSAFGAPTTSPFGLPATSSAASAGLSGFATSSAPSTGFNGFATSPAPSSGFPAFATSSAPSSGLPTFATSATPPTGFSGFAASSAPSTGFPGASTSTAGPSLSIPSQATGASPTEDDKRKVAEEQRRKLEEAQRKAQEEEEKRKAEAERQRIAEEQRRRAEEEQRRRALEEQAKARAAEQQRQLREQQRQERLRAEQEAARRIEELKRQALEAAAKDLMDDPKDGMMRQYIQNLVANMVTESKKALMREKQAENDALADRMYQRKRLELAQRTFYKWFQYVTEKKRHAEARRHRQRRKQLKAEIEAARNSAASSVASSAAPEVQAVTGVAVDRPLTSYPNGSRNSLSNGLANGTRKRKQVPEPTVQNGETSDQPPRDYSKSYYESLARRPLVDRTETDWFKLRSMGVDPSKVRKRSFGSRSSDEDEAPEVDNKRARHATPSGLRRSLPPPATDEERLARFQAIKDSLKKHNQGSRSFDGSQSFDARASRLIARARESLAQDSPSRQSTPEAAFARSTGTPLSTRRPAYWERQSRFVPQHLYGQPEAIRAYRFQISGRSAEGIKPVDIPPPSAQPKEASNPPNFLSSPIPTQQSYHPSAHTQRFIPPSAQTKEASNPPNLLSSPIPTQQSYHPSAHTQQFLEVESEHAVDDDADAEDEGDMVELDGFDEEVEDGDETELDGFDEEEEYGGEAEEQEEYYSEDEESYSEEEEVEEQFAQKPGATQDDAIELSD